MSYLRKLRARKIYICDGCGKYIRVGDIYFRDEPHPMAKRHRGEMVRYICGECIPLPRWQDSFYSTDTNQTSLFDIGILDLPNILIQSAIIETGVIVEEGQMVIGIALPWFEIIREIEHNPKSLFDIPWRKLEELIAGAYQREGWHAVILTPCSGDKGRDIIVEKHGVGAIRIVDQVKAYSPNHRVTADDVRSLLGVLTVDSNISKGIITTTADFAPGIKKDKDIQRFIPYRLEMRSGAELRAWLVSMLQNTLKR